MGQEMGGKPLRPPAARLPLTPGAARSRGASPHAPHPGGDIFMEQLSGGLGWRHENDPLVGGSWSHWCAWNVDHPENPLLAGSSSPTPTRSLLAVGTRGAPPGLAHRRSGSAWASDRKVSREAPRPASRWTPTPGRGSWVVQDLGIPSPAQWRYAWVTMRPKLVRHWQCPWLRVSLGHPDRAVEHGGCQRVGWGSQSSRLSEDGIRCAEGSSRASATGATFS